jgi:methyltransferase family protein
LSDHVGLTKRFRLIHIDGSHLFEIVQQDIKLSKDILKDDGIVIFDDYRSPHTPGVLQHSGMPFFIKGFIRFA